MAAVNRYIHKNIVLRPVERCQSYYEKPFKVHRSRFTVQNWKLNTRIDGLNEKNGKDSASYIAATGIVAFMDE